MRRSHQCFKPAIYIQQLAFYLITLRIINVYLCDESVDIKKINNDNCYEKCQHHYIVSLI